MCLKRRKKRKTCSSSSSSRRRKRMLVMMMMLEATHDKARFWRQEVQLQFLGFKKLVQEGHHQTTQGHLRTTRTTRTTQTTQTTREHRQTTQNHLLDSIHLHLFLTLDSPREVPVFRSSHLLHQAQGALVRVMRLQKRTLIQVQVQVQVLATKGLYQTHQDLSSGRHFGNRSRMRRSTSGDGAILCLYCWPGVCSTYKFARLGISVSRTRGIKCFS